MTRRIAFVLAVAAGSAFVAPASADRECFDDTCRMPEVIEAPPAPAAEEPAVDPKVTAVAAPPDSPVAAAPEASRTQATADTFQQHNIEPLAKRPVEPQPRKPVRRIAAQAPLVNEPPIDPVEMVSSRQYAAVEAPSQGTQYAPHHAQPYTGAGIVVVVPGVQYGADGVALEQSRQDPSWRLCQTDRSGRPCTPYNYQPYGAYGYRPLGSYQQPRPVPTYVYVPGAKVITIDEAVPDSVR